MSKETGILLRRVLKWVVIGISVIAFSGLIINLFRDNEDNTPTVSGDKELCIHSWDDGEVTVVSTCSEEGEKVVTCKDCGATEKRKVDKLPHTEVYIAMTPATCTEDGLTDGKKCSVCEEVTIAPSVIPALGHKKVIDKAVAPTCLETGLTEGVHCGRCEIVFKAQEEIPATGHNVVSDIEKEPTCFENGLTGFRYCSDCQTTFAEQETIDRLEHEFIDNYCTKCGMFELEQLLTMDSSQYTATAVSEGTALEKGAIYRINVNNDDREGIFVYYGLIRIISEVEGISVYNDNWRVRIYNELRYFTCQFYEESNSAFLNNGIGAMDCAVKSEDDTYAYLYVPENIASYKGASVQLLAGAGMEKITLK